MRRHKNKTVVVVLFVLRKETLSNFVGFVKSKTKQSRRRDHGTNNVFAHRKKRGFGEWRVFRRESFIFFFIFLKKEFCFFTAALCPARGAEKMEQSSPPLRYSETCQMLSLSMFFCLKRRDEMETRRETLSSIFFFIPKLRFLHVPAAVSSAAAAPSHLSSMSPPAAPALSRLPLPVASSRD